MTVIDPVLLVAQSLAKSRIGLSSLPKQAMRLHHMMNNLASRPDTRLLHIGHDVSYALWGNEHARVHWVDEDVDEFQHRPDIAPYNLVIVDHSSKRRPFRPIKRQVDNLDTTFVYFVNGWGKAEVRKGVRRDLASLERWDSLLEVEAPNEHFGVFVLQK